MNRTRLMAFLLAILSASPVSRAQSAAPNRSGQVLAYFEHSGSYDSLTAFHSDVTQLSTDTFGVDVHGRVTGTAPTNALALAKSKGMPTFACISNFGAHDFDPKIAHAIITSPKMRAGTISRLLKLVREAGYSGINIDFESINREERTQFTAFVHEVAQKMRAAGYLTVVSVPATLKDNPNDGWTGAFDFAALGRDADILQVMTYDEHGPWGKPGPVAGLPWMEQSIQFAVSVVAPQKLSLGIPVYGYDWNTSKGSGVMVHWKDIPALIASTGASPQWDAESSSPFFNYQASDGSSHVVWYEDAKSIPLKSALAASYKLAGVSVFALGYEDSSFWQALRAGSGLNQVTTQQ